MLWTYEHPTARFQEMMLFPSVGIETVPTYTDFQTSWLDNRYHDESHSMYPAWRQHVSLPVNVVENIRKLKLWERNFVVTDDEADLINSAFDIIFINCSEETLRNIFSWFKGLVLFRCNGGPNAKLLFQDAEGWLEAAKAYDAADRFLYLPSTLKLIPPSFVSAGIKIINMPVYVDVSRIPGAWTKAASRTIATSISYLDFHDHFQGQLSSLGDAYSNEPFKIKVFGKNKQKTSPSGNIEIVGGLPDESLFWSGIFGCEVFVDAGRDPTHNIFPPLEAMAKGMPILFPEGNGNVEAIRDAYPDVLVDESMGVFSDHYAIARFLRGNIGRVDLFHEIHNRQSKLFLDYFSKANALRAAAQIRDHMLNRTVIGKMIKVASNHQTQFLFQKRSLKQIWTDTVNTQSVSFNTLVHRIGEGKSDGSILVNSTQSHLEEQVICEYLPSVPAGEYEIVVEYQARSEDGGIYVGTLEVGEWVGGQIYESEAVKLGLGPEMCVKSFVVEDANAMNQRELRLSVCRNVDVVLKTLRLSRRDSK
jgi:hypothetical protein